MTQNEILAWFNMHDTNHVKNSYSFDREGRLHVVGNVEIQGMKTGSFPFVFGRIKGDFKCADNGLTTLEHGPVRVAGRFDCSGNHLTSLEYAPEYVFQFDCSKNQLTTLEHAPKKVTQAFWCQHNQLVSLKGAPRHANFDFDCSYNQLESLEHAPYQVKGKFNCSHNQLTTLEHAPRSVDHHYYCHNNKLVSLVGGPYSAFDFDCSYNELTDFEGMPQFIRGSLQCTHNRFISFKGCPDTVKYQFKFGFNEPVDLKELTTEIGQEFQHNCLRRREHDINGEASYEEVGKFLYFEEHYSYGLLQITPYELNIAILTGDLELALPKKAETGRKIKI